MFGRRSADAEKAALESSQADTAEYESPLSKGRPTPKRKDAEAARKQRLTPPRNRKEAAALHRERVREHRAKQRAALAGSGEDRYLPPRDQGAVKKLIRDYVDSHRTIGELLIPIFLVMFLGVIALQRIAYLGTFAWLAIIILLVADSVRMVRGVKRVIRERFGDNETRGITMYTLMRCWQMRRLRLPKPTVRPGDAY